MQFMYLRSKNGKKNNLGRHPLGIIGVTTTSDNKLAVSVSLIHSSDNFNKKTARELIYIKLQNLKAFGPIPNVDRPQVFSPNEPVPELYTLLPKQFPKRIDYPRQQKGFARMISDEIALHTPKDGSTGQLVPGNL